LTEKCQAHPSVATLKNKGAGKMKPSMMLQKTKQMILLQLTSSMTKTHDGCKKETNYITITLQLGNQASDDQKHRSLVASHEMEVGS